MRLMPVKSCQIVQVLTNRSVLFKVNEMRPQKNHTRKIKATLSIDIALGVWGGKWKMLILFALIEKPQRTSALQRLLPEISERILIRQLRELEKNLLISRKIYPSAPPKVEYTVTEYGKTLKPMIQQLSAWGYDHLKKMNRQRVVYRVRKFDGRDTKQQ